LIVIVLSVLVVLNTASILNQLASGFTRDVSIGLVDDRGRSHDSTKGENSDTGEHDESIKNL
jgi:hypothetical protein